MSTSHSFDAASSRPESPPPTHRSSASLSGSLRQRISDTFSTFTTDIHPPPNFDLTGTGFAVSEALTAKPAGSASGGGKGKNKESWGSSWGSRFNTHSFKSNKPDKRDCMKFLSDRTIEEVEAAQDLVESTFPMAVRIRPGEEVEVKLPPGKERRKGAKPTWFPVSEMHASAVYVVLGTVWWEWGLSLLSLRNIAINILIAIVISQVAVSPPTWCPCDRSSRQIDLKASLARDIIAASPPPAPPRLKHFISRQNETLRSTVAIVIQSQHPHQLIIVGIINYSQHPLALCNTQFPTPNPLALRATAWGKLTPPPASVLRRMDTFSAPPPHIIQPTSPSPLQQQNVKLGSSQLLD
ncbi:hypothetical protein DFH27DRAFT_652081 [Peziza echinospora]|nr:hypothetical protein DFH27DRAFT_652081 [Peziza echinospora]